MVANITYDDDKAGVFYLSRDLRDVHRRLVVGSATIIGLLLLAVAAALALAQRMQRSISEPLLDLADTARRISDEPRLLDPRQPAGARRDRRRRARLQRDARPHRRPDGGAVEGQHRAEHE